MTYERYDCPGCGETMRLGGTWVDLIEEDGHDVPACPDCNETGDEWTFDPRINRRLFVQDGDDS